MTSDIIALVLGLIGLGLGLLAFVTARGGGQAREQAAEKLRLQAEQILAGIRAESDTTRSQIAATERGLTGAIQTGTTGALTRAFEQITQATTAVGASMDTMRLSAVEEQRRIAAALDLQLTTLRESNEKRLAEMQATVNEQLHAAVEKQMEQSFARVVDQFTAVQKALGDVQAVTAQIGDIKRLFTNVKTRGGWGEAQLRAMLEDVLPAGSFEANRKLREDTDDMVDFAVAMPMRGSARVWLPVDAKFPVEDYERLIAATEAGDAEGEKQARRGLERRLRDESRKIYEKYINPPVTVEFGVLYLATDGLYAEVARVPGLLEEMSRECRVMILGPSLFPALLRTVQLGHITLALEEKADQIRALLGATKTEMMKMDAVLGKLAKNASSMSNTIEAARTRARQVNRKLRGLESIEGARADELLELDASLPALEQDDAEG
ncbi:DNA recombination protein RmuC [Acidisoma cellulosilytica]|uniref:DNA recombination protein RmuC homolog n=1 Tax=Acidisoma cellulosilyticum TaxID=2802395 RepID=A0A963Z318_9PROT|nr:DNA recombination protein RmuC [Acidisoma cellulosilyticum]MCB8881574.1 DNA recombination protein RmuC [Acidisoma cellulosilyticum]